MRSQRTALLLLAGLAVAGCGGTGAKGAAVPGQGVPRRVTAETYGESLRLFHKLPLDHDAREPLRERIVAHLERQTPGLLEAGDYDAVVEHFAEMSALFAPEDFARGELPEALRAPARFLLRRASARGDEGRAMAALHLLRVLHPGDEKLVREYRQVAEWGRQARSTLDNPLARYTELIEVWQEHARLTPAPEVLDTLADLHVERRDAIVEMVKSGEGLTLGGGPGSQGFGVAPQHLLRRAPFEVVAVYLQHGDVASAITRLRGMGQVTDLEGQLLRMLEDVRAGGEEAIGAMVELAEAYRGARPAVATGLCRYGLRRLPDNPSFPACLARVAAAEERYAAATAWYADAIDLAPGKRPLYDEALEKLNEFIERDMFDSDPAEARQLAAQAGHILRARTRRWPGSPPPVTPQQLHLLVATLEMNAGNTDEARRRFEKSLEVEVTTKGLLQLGLLEERTGNQRRAAELYERALERTPRDTPADALKRAEILEHLADARRKAGQPDEARPLYRKTLDLLDQVLPELEGPPLSIVQVRRGVVLDRLGRDEEAKDAFVAAMAAAPHWRETYASILSHLVVVRPDMKLAHQVFQRAQRQLTLEPEWKVYFALWVALIAGRADEPPPPDVRRLLRNLAAGTAWWSRLAKFGAGKLPYQELLSEASNIGEQAEAHFYEGARRLANGDREGARGLFERVLATQMVSFYEFVMARELALRSANRAAAADH